ncbi:hypothetical protein NKH85_21445 [Mesorhizobium sp. M0924]|uniref:hypothetical protein n=1 Tax=unclassified Mesorhizobium TaxID=325217 RepID=UPI0012DEA134|nr:MULTISPECIES: hypothetical protein [unclassified Mesorhizobium]WJI44611.1 hypothetical protein NL532_29130 [Mesorhizobium sp. C120A]
MNVTRSIATISRAISNPVRTRLRRKLIHGNREELRNARHIVGSPRRNFLFLDFLSATYRRLFLGLLFGRNAHDRVAGDDDPAFLALLEEHLSPVVEPALRHD